MEKIFIIFIISVIILLIISLLLFVLKCYYWPLKNAKFRIVKLTKYYCTRYRPEVYKPLVGYTAFKIIMGNSYQEISQTDDYYALLFSDAEKNIESYLNIADKSKIVIEVTSYFPNKKS